MLAISLQSVLALIAAATLASASPRLDQRSQDASTKSGPLGLNNVKCSDVTLRTSITTQNFDFVNVIDNYDSSDYVTSTFLAFTGRNEQWVAEHFPGTRSPVSSSFTLRGSYCEPIRGAKKGSSLLLATHGIGFNRSYWRYPYKGPEYSFVNHAASYGYSSFIYDRIGTGKSDIPTSGGFSRMQSPTEVGVLTNILEQARNSNVIGGKKHARIVGIGHSYGSGQTLAVTSARPELLDGVALTGLTPATEYVPDTIYSGAYTPMREIAGIENRNRPRIWIATGSRTSLVQNYIDPDNADAEAVNIARRGEEGVTLGIYTTLGNIASPAPAFNKPVLVLNGNHDLPFCGSNCERTVPPLPEGLRAIYPAASNFTSIIIPNTGHGIAVHRSGPDSHEILLDWVISNGL
ncbi:alpha/beta-hydrolase [Ceraceosorus guamensis]|uniref:Alpha/beta-hydrolase n=1 Tax=Ceraceosorus guamensis TaxID=1522189 RepID=A0A316VMZ1_9BASI|nr:alpha/beta-hydrolase [Ceraceosorus guamensis]PWN38927.1 alpha/beta-hydrolase [Ceraceosorus guamensis]